MNTSVASLPAAGRELDALVAERVMGFWFEDDHWWTRHRDGASRAYATAYLNLWGPTSSWDGLPKFSTDIAAAWAVVEHLRTTTGENVTVWWNNGQLSAYGEAGWECQIAFPPRAPTAISGCCETAPLAICRAALQIALRHSGNGVGAALKAVAP